MIKALTILHVTSLSTVDYGSLQFLFVQMGGISPVDTKEIPKSIPIDGLVFLSLRMRNPKVI